MADREPAPTPESNSPAEGAGGAEPGGTVTGEEVAEDAPERLGEGEDKGGGIGAADIYQALGITKSKDPKKTVRKLEKAVGKLGESLMEAREALIETRKEREQALAERDEARDERLRAVAEFANTRKRLQREKETVVNQASERVAGQMLPALDAMDAALSIDFQTPAERKMWEGLQAVRSLLLEVLKREGLIPIEAVRGTAFDPAVHEAADMAEGSEEGSGEMVVDEEFRRGYRFLDGRVIRNSSVRVAFVPSEISAGGEESEAAVGSEEELEAPAPVEGEPVESEESTEAGGGGAAAGAEEGSETKAES